MGTATILCSCQRMFSSRIAQHLLLTMIAAPFLVKGHGLLRRRLPPLGAASAFAGLFCWHARLPHAPTLTADITYQTTHLAPLGAGCALRSALLGAPLASLSTETMAAVATGVQMSLLGIVLLLSAKPRHASPIAGARLRGLTALTDQQIAAGLSRASGALVVGAVAAGTGRFRIRRIETTKVQAADA